MKCPGCGYVSFDARKTCKRCGGPLSATGKLATGPADPAPARQGEDRQPALDGLVLEPARPARGRARRRGKGTQPAPRSPGPVEMLDDDALEISEEDLAPAPGTAAQDAGMPFHIDEDLFGDQAFAGDAPATRGEEPARGEPWPPFSAESSGPVFVLDEEECAAGAPVIDRDEEIPDRFWVPEIAGLGRRAAALAVDLALLALVLGAFFVAALLALQLSGFDTRQALAPPGLRAALLPFVLLAVVLSLAYQVFFHSRTGSTPGKALAGLALRTADGGHPSRGRVVLRWFCAGLGLAAAGVGFAWALVEPRRRSWADLLSGTVVARRRREPAGGGGRR